VDLSEVRLRKLPANYHMLPGVALSAETEAGRRSVISYFLYPLLRGLDKSTREPSERCRHDDRCYQLTHGMRSIVG
jgi:HlyD family secretion protein